MAKKDSVKKGNKKAKKEQIQSVIEETAPAVLEKVEVKNEPLKEENKEVTSVTIDVVEEKSIKSIEIPISLERTDEIVEEAVTENNQSEKEEKPKKKEVKTYKETYGYDHMGLIYSY